ncbi:electron transfer flavoprotein subunit beta/FixA family protein [uncultured Sphaerochaeta sp.]|uniref:electron transfer flavoprotein subunit beta/FixA family protein n=1 Tax=uncultured Sphaerochaeta sp. TaxID=886478 RepID=UPI002A0A93D4|nr:electron transfer flavoprotein subunit beta/FixA family protein [uncultured Sphaerochaeta sp.]
MINIIVCVKQVPGTSNVKVDEKTGVLVRPKMGNKMNPNDLFAIEMALRLKEELMGTVTALTMGPPQAVQSIEEAVAMGCDHGIILSDRAFGGADVLSTSYTLSQGISKVGRYDIVICGKQTTDGDTAQVGAELAEHLGIPHLANVSSIGKVKEGKVHVTAFQENLIVEETLTLPCLLAVDSEVNTPRLPSFKRMKQNTEKPVIFALSDLPDNEVCHYGLKGSPTQVEKIFPPEKNVKNVMFKGTGTENAVKLAALLFEKKYI